MEYIELIAIRTRYTMIFFVICLFFIFISLFIIGKFQTIMRKYEEDYFPAKKF